MGELDVAAKALLREQPAAFIRLALPGREVQNIEPDETELHAFERRLDKLFRVELVGEREPTWVHIEVEAVWAADVPSRVFGYWSLAHRTRPSVRSVVVVLRRGDRQGEPTGVYEASVLGERVLSFGFDTVCAWKLDAHELLERKDLGLLPLVPFARGTSRDRVEDAFRILAARRTTGSELEAVLAVFSERVFPGGHWLGRIPKEFLMESESEIFKEIQAIGRRKLVRTQLRHRLGKSKRTESLLARLTHCSDGTIDKIGVLVVKSTKKNLFPALDRLLPKESSLPTE